MLKLLAAIFLAFGLVGSAVAQAPVAPAAAPSVFLPRHHPWARFAPGSRSHVQVVSQTLNAEGVVTETDVSTIITTLERVTDDSVTLRVESVVEVAGRKLPSPPQTLTKDFWGSVGGRVTLSPETAEDVVTIGGQTYPVTVYTLRMDNDQSNCQHRVAFEPRQWPHILRREWECRDSAGNLLVHGQIDTLSVNMPMELMGTIAPVAHVQTVQKWPSGKRVVTIEVYCSEVPGGIVSQTMKEIDPQGRLVRRSMLQLLGYQIVSRQAPPSSPGG